MGRLIPEVKTGATDLGEQDASVSFLLAFNRVSVFIFIGLGLGHLQAGPPFEIALLLSDIFGYTKQNDY